MNVDNNKGGGDPRHVGFALMAEMYKLDENCGDEQISNTLWHSVKYFPTKLSSSAYFFLVLTDSLLADSTSKDYKDFEKNRRNDIRAMKRA